MSNNAKILLVDDDPGLLRLLRIRLDAAGYEVDAAKNGEQALGRLPVFQPHLMFTDLRMGGMDGMALHADGSRTIQGTERGRTISVSTNLLTRAPFYSSMKAAALSPALQQQLSELVLYGPGLLSVGLRMSPIDGPD